MNKKLIIGVVTLLLIVSLIIVFTPSNSENINNSSNTEEGQNNMGERPAMNGDTDGEQTDMRPPMQDGEEMSAPPEAIDACSNLSEGTACSFSGRDGTISGTCTIDGEILACGP